MGIKTLILDLDGPILDTRDRHYACYRDILMQYDQTVLTQEDYWQRKRMGQSNREILTAMGCGHLVKSFQQAWLARIETDKYLKYDHMQPGAIEKLQQWHQSGYEMLLVTLRQSQQRLMSQLTQLQIDLYFNHILICEHAQGGHGKADAVRHAVPWVMPTQALWIGDSEVDWIGAQNYGCLFGAVSGGVRSPQYLQKIGVERISPSLGDIDLNG